MRITIRAVIGSLQLPIAGFGLLLLVGVSSPLAIVVALGWKLGLFSRNESGSRFQAFRGRRAKHVSLTPEMAGA
ncbi:hypothetical protein [Haladaptatus sp. DFWS20]|uniref:hypothetical protein n=1 Tax=Haladaptatus sp. DFWS20 TaxID=3403467 RepID=UPI003EBFFB87